MALFKILRGKKEDLNTYPITDGYAYFTPEDGKFYIDVSETNGVEPKFGISTTDGANRICINSNPFVEDLIFDCGNAFGWAKTQIVYFDLGNSVISGDESNIIIYDSGNSKILPEEQQYVIIYDSGDSSYNI